jgi:predicted enzyme related to lactoylglutathione lyase
MSGMVSVEIYVDDVVATAGFFENYLGFRTERLESTFAALWLGRSRILLNAVDSGEFVTPNPILKDGAVSHRGAGLEIVISVEDIDATHARLQDTDLPYVGPIKEQFWGLRDFRMLLLEGFYLRVTEADEEVRQMMS